MRREGGTKGGVHNVASCSCVHAWNVRRVQKRAKEGEREKVAYGLAEWVSEGVRSTNQYLLDPACVPAVHDARNVSPTDPNPMDDIAAASIVRHMSSYV